MIDCDTLAVCQTRIPRCPDCLIGPADERHRCEVRYVLRLRDTRGILAAKQWINGLLSVRSAQAVNKLRDDATSQWKAGNRGLAGDWRQV
jgi:hypothetical protein